MKKQQNFAYVFVLPFFALVAIFQAYPIIDTLMTSLTDENLSATTMVPQFVGFENYFRELSASLVAKALCNTLLISAFSMVIQIGLALLVTFWLTSHELKLRRQNAWLVIFFLPSQIAISIITLYLVLFFDSQYGLINQAIFGANAVAYIDFTGTGVSTWVFIIAASVFISFGITAYFLVNSVRSLPKQSLEAAIIDGATARQVFWHISLPHIQPILGFIVIITLILNLCLFDLPYSLFPAIGGSGVSQAALGVNGGVDQNGVTLATYAYQRAFVWDSDLGSASAVVVLMFGLIAILCFIYFRLMKRGGADFSVLR